MQQFSQKLTHYAVYAVTFFLIAFFLAFYLWFNRSFYYQQWFLGDLFSQNSDLFQEIDFLDLNAKPNQEKIARLDAIVHSISGSLRGHWLDGELNEVIGNSYLAQWDPQKALNFFRTYDAEGLFNRSNAQLFSAYQLAAQSSLYSGLTDSFQLVYQSISGYELAFSFVSDPFLSKKIQTHLTMARNLSTVITVKFVLAQLRFVVDNIDLISRQIKYLSALFSQQKASLDAGWYPVEYEQCLREYSKTIQTNEKSFTTLALVLTQKRDGYFKKIVDCVDDPSLCLQPLDENLIESMSGIRTQFAQLMVENDMILAALKKKDKDFLKQWCQWESLKDNQSEVQKNIDELLESLGVQDKKKSEQASGSSQEVFYEDIPKGEDDKLMNQIYQQNLNWIDQMQSLKSDKNYDPGQMLRELFIEFYGKEEF